MRWAKDPRYTTAGGFWRCAIKQRAYWSRYDTSAKGRARKRRYHATPGGALNRQFLEMTRIRVRY